MGGFVESERNLSAAPEDNAWIYDDAIAAGDACVDLDACLRGRAVACGQAYVSQHAILTGEARAEDNSYVRGAAMAEKARASGYSVICPSRTAKAIPVLNGNSAVYGTVMGDVRLTGNAVVLGEERITNETLDTLVIDGAVRSVLRDPSRDELAPSQPVQHKDKQKKRGGLSR